MLKATQAPSENKKANAGAQEKQGFWLRNRRCSDWHGFAREQQ
jgi:hypothetical protein